MSKHNETGLKGEQIAEKFLIDKGYEVLHRNWCSGKKEIDLVTLKDGRLVFVEVKTRSGTGFGFPEEAVTEKKQSHLKQAAEAYLEDNPGHKEIQFDIVSISLKRGAPAEILHLEDAFY